MSGNGYVEQVNQRVNRRFYQLRNLKKSQGFLVVMKPGAFAPGFNLAISRETLVEIQNSGRTQSLDLRSSLFLRPKTPYMLPSTA